MRRIVEIDGLRFFAILAVIAVHYRPPFRPGLNALSLGWVGVDLFFIISGFLITTNLVSLRDKERPYRVFYWRRTLRIFPPYYLVVSLLVAHQVLAHLPLLPGFTYQPLLFLSAFSELHPLSQALRTLFHLGPLNHRILAIDNHTLDGVTSGFGVLWSLSFEEMFYLFWAPFMLKCSRRTLLTVILLTIAASPVLRMFGHTPEFRECFFFPFRFDTLAMGSLLALVCLAWRKGEIPGARLRRWLLVSAIASLMAVAAIAMWVGVLRGVEVRSTLLFATFGYSLVGIFFFSIVGLCVMHAGSNAWWTRTLRAGPLVYIGTVSYMLYLIHIPVFVIVTKGLGRLAGHPLTPALWQGIVAFAAAVAVASLSWKFFEQPILKFKDAVPALPRKPIVNETTTPDPVPLR
jgi:peptidoglycan/LPS O-acetylase OafA/YrhL